MPNIALSADRPGVSFTVFTATYERAHLLHRAYESLRAQTFRDFEWIVGDDGSTDDTAALVQEWQQVADFPIYYFWQKHAGKNFVFNRGVREAKGEYFAELASDDSLKAGALELAYSRWREIDPSDRVRYFAIMFSCEDELGNVVGPFFETSPIDYDYRQFNYSPKYRCEKWQCFRTEVLRRYPFREDVVGCHIFESTLFCEIGKAYKARFSNEIARVYFLDGPSMTRQLKHPMANAEGWRLSVLYTLNNDLDFFFCRPLHFISKAMNFARFSFHFKLSLNQQLSSLTAYSGKMLWALMLPIALLIFYIDRFRSNTPEDAERVG